MSDVQEQSKEQASDERSALDAANQNADRVDAALDKHLAKAGIELPDDNARPRGADGKFIKKETPSETFEQSQDDPADLDGEQSKYSDDEIMRAVAAAQRYRAPKSVLKAIEKGDEDAISYGLHIAKIQSDAEDFTKRYHSLQQELEQIKSRPAANSGVVEGKGNPDATASASSIDKLAEYLAESLGDEEAKKVVRESLAGLAKPADTSELEAAKQQVALLQKQVEALAMERARDALVSEYPDLKDKGVWDRVKKTAETLPESNDRPDLQTRLEHAARIELAPELIRRAKAEQERRNKVRDNGTHSAPSRAVDPKTRATISQLQDELLEAMEAGDEARIKEARAALHARTRM